MLLLSKWTAHKSSEKTDEQRKRAIVFPLYNKAFKLLADSNIPLFCLSAGGAGEERVIDHGPTDTLFKAKAGAEKAAVWVVAVRTVYRSRASHLSLTDCRSTAPTELYPLWYAAPNKISISF